MPLLLFVQPSLLCSSLQNKKGLLLAKLRVVRLTW
jgi:hypothetical protein